MLALIDAVAAAPDIVRHIACDAVTRDDAPDVLSDGSYFDAVHEDEEIEPNDAFMASLREVWRRASEEEITLGFNLAVWAAQSANSEN
jgi:hypothetical protein